MIDIVIHQSFFIPVMNCNLSGGLEKYSTCHTSDMEKPCPCRLTTDLEADRPEASERIIWSLPSGAEITG